MQNNPLKEIYTLLSEPKNKVLIMDCEYYGCEPNSKEQRLFQVSGRVFNSDLRFDHYIYDTKVSEGKRFKLLKQTNITYSEAVKLSPQFVLASIKSFIRENNITHLLFFDDSLDHKQLVRESNEAGINFFDNVRVFDLSEYIANSVMDNKHKISLRSLIMLLGIPHNYSFHNARFDVEAIYKICMFYYDVFDPYNQSLLLDEYDIFESE